MGNERESSELRERVAVERENFSKVDEEMRKKKEFNLLSIF